MRLQDINELLEETEHGIRLLEEENATAQTDNEKLNLSRPKAKNVLENFRSVLDYIAADITEALREEYLKRENIP